MLSANDNMNMKELKAKLFSEICFIHEKKVSEDPVVKKIINMIYEMHDYENYFP
jgi:hypothetical protein